MKNRCDCCGTGALGDAHPLICSTCDLIAQGHNFTGTRDLINGMPRRYYFTSHLQTREAVTFRVNRLRRQAERRETNAAA